MDNKEIAPIKKYDIHPAVADAADLINEQPELLPQFVKMLISAFDVSTSIEKREVIELLPGILPGELCQSRPKPKPADPCLLCHECPRN